MLRRLSVGQHHARVALQGGDVAIAELTAVLSWDQQEHRLAHDRVDAGMGERLSLVESFIDGDDQLGNRPQPGEPGITGEKLKEMIRRANRFDFFFIDRTLGLKQNPVQAEQRIVQFQ